MFDSKRVGLVTWVGNDYTLHKTSLTGSSKKTRVKKYRIIKAYKGIMTLFVHDVSQVEMRNHRPIVVPNEVIPWRGRHIFQRDASWDGHNTN